MSMRAKLLFLFSAMFLVMMLRTASAQAGYCPNGEDYSPCTCYRRNNSINYAITYRVTCESIALTDVANVFRRTTSVDLEEFYLYPQPADPTKTIPAGLLNNHRIEHIAILCLPTGSPLKVDSQALRSSQTLMGMMDLWYCDMSQLNFDFLSGFNKLWHIYYRYMSNVGQANWASFPQLPSLTHLHFYNSTGLNEWRTFPQLARGLLFLTLERCDIQDEAMNRILNWTLQYSANTLHSFYMGNNELTKIPKQFQAPNSFPNLYWFDISHQKKGMPMITTGGGLPCRGSSSSHHRLDAQRNQITTIDAGFFQGNCSRATINLASNLLSRFEEAIFKEVLIQIRSGFSGRLHVYNNPFNCELDMCHLAWLIRDNRDLLNYLEGAECSNGTAFKQLNPSGFTGCPSNGNPTTTQKTATQTTAIQPTTTQTTITQAITTQAAATQATTAQTTTPTTKAPTTTIPKPVEDHSPSHTAPGYLFLILNLSFVSFWVFRT